PGPLALALALVLPRPGFILGRRLGRLPRAARPRRRGRRASFRGPRSRRRRSWLWRDSAFGWRRCSLLLRRLRAIDDDFRQRGLADGTIARRQQGDDRARQNEMTTNADTHG